MTAIRFLVNYALILTSPVWVLPAFLFFFWVDRNDLPAWTKGAAWFWDAEPSTPAFRTHTPLVDVHRELLK